MSNYKNIELAYLLFCLATLPALQLYGQSELTPSWEIVKESTNGNQAEAWALGIDSENHIYWSISVNNSNLGLDIETYKLDFEGNEIWNSPSSYSHAGTQQAYVLNCESPFLYVGGRNCEGLVLTCDMLILKINKDDGTIIWDKSLNYNANGYDEVDGISILNDNIYCSGWAQEIQGNIYQSDMGLWSLDANGNTIWKNSYGNAGTAEHLDGHSILLEDNIYAAGLWGGTGIANLYNGQSFVGKFSIADGTLIDSVLFASPSNNMLDIENALSLTTDGEHIYTTGYTIPEGRTDWQIFVAKFDLDLELVWYTDWGGESTESARSIVVDDKYIYVGGLSESKSIIGQNERDAVLLTFNKEGSLLGYSHFGEEDSYSIHEISIGDEIYISGTSEDVLNSSKKSAFLIKTDLITSLKEEHNVEPNALQIFPNPTHGLVNIKNARNYKSFDIFDLKGNLLNNTVINSDEIMLDVNVYQSNVLFIRFCGEKSCIVRKLILE